jgi:hypothetical protein
VLRPGRAERSGEEQGDEDQQALHRRLPSCRPITRPPRSIRTVAPAPS